MPLNILSLDQEKGMVWKDSGFPTIARTGLAPTGA